MLGLYFGLKALDANADLTNGNFENGLNGWTVITAGDANAATIASGVTTASAGTLQASPTADHYVYTSQNGGGYSILSQAFTVQGGVNRLFFDVAINNGASAFYTPDSLSYGGAPANQQARFDILKPGSSLTSMNPNDIIVTVYKTQVGDPLTQNWTTKQFDVSGQLSSYVGQNVILRFWQADNQMYFNLALDNVNVGISQLAQLLSTQTAATQMRNTPGFNASGVIDNTPGLLTLFTPQTGDNHAISDSLTQTLPLLTGSSMVAAQGALSGINRVIQARIEGNRGMSSGNDFYGDKNIWFKPFGSRANQSDRNGVSGYKAETYGLAFGVDGTINPATRLGAAFAYAKSDINSSSSIAPQSADVSVYQLIGYGSYSLDDRTEINFQADFGQNANKGKRQIAFTSTTATSDYDSYTGHVGVGLDRTYPLTSQTSITPSVRADYTWIKDKSYAENGAGLLNLSVDSRTTEAFVISTNGKIAHQLNDQITLTANLGVGYDTMSKQSAITATFAGAPGAAFVTYGIDPSPWIGQAGFGTVYKTKSGLELAGRYDVEYRESFLNQTASIKARWAF